jgi:hypothetical protein
VVLGSAVETGASLVGVVDAVTAGIVATDYVQDLGLGEAGAEQQGSDVATVVGSNNAVIGGSGENIITALGSKNAIVGGASDDTITAIGTWNAIVGGAGDDIVTAVGKYAAVVAGEGDNVVTLLGKGNAVTAGDGDDIVTSVSLSSSTTTKTETGSTKSADLNFNAVYAGDGHNIVTQVGAENLAVTGDDQDIVTLVNFGSSSSSSNAVEEEGGATTTTETSYDTSLNAAYTGGGNDVAVIYGQHNLLLSAGGDDVVVVVGSSSSFKTETKTETVTDDETSTSKSSFSIDTGFNVAITGDGDDIAVLKGVSTVAVTGAGDDTVVSLSNSANLVFTGEGNDTVIAIAPATIFNSIEAVAENDWATLGDGIGGGMSMLSVGYQAYSLYKGNMGSVYAVGNVIDAGDGNDVVFASSAGSYVGGGDGDDVMMGFGWGLIDHLLNVNASDISGAVDGLSAALGDVKVYLSDSLLGDIAKAFDGLTDQVVDAAQDVADIVTDVAGSVDGLLDKGLGSLSSVTGLDLDFDVSGGVDSAMDTSIDWLTSAMDSLDTTVEGWTDDGWLADAFEWIGNAAGDVSDVISNADNSTGFTVGLSALMGYLTYSYSGNNDLTAGAGNDTLYSGMGDDDLRGGSGTDTYVFYVGDGRDTIYETAGGNDHIEVHASRLWDEDFTLSTSSIVTAQDGGDLVIGFVQDGVCYGRITIADQASVDVQDLTLYDTAGQKITTVDIDTLVAQEKVSYDKLSGYDMASIWSEEKLSEFSELVVDALTGATTTSSHSDLAIA